MTLLPVPVQRFVLCSAAALLLIPSAQAQREEMVQLQREMAQVQQRIRNLEEVNTTNFANVVSLLERAMASTAQLSTDMMSLEKRLSDNMATQQTQVAGPVQAVQSRVDGVSNSVEGLREDIARLSSRMGTMETTLSDISRTVRDLAAQPISAAPPPPGANTEQALVLLNGAKGDLMAGRDDMAMVAVTTYLRDYPNTAGAPEAMLIMGRIYDTNGQDEDAIKAFDRVLEQWGENPHTRDAMFSKALSLRKVGRNADAAATLRDYVDKYPTDPNAERARVMLRDLGR